MTIEIKRNAEETIVELGGRLDTTTAPALDKTINDALGDTKTLILNVKGLDQNPDAFQHQKFDNSSL